MSSLPMLQSSSLQGVLSCFSSTKPFWETLLVETDHELETHRKLYDGDVYDEKLWQNEVDDVLCKVGSSYWVSSFVFW
jgi:hypothetical protein